MGKIYTSLSYAAVITLFVLVTAFSGSLKEGAGMGEASGSPGDGGADCSDCHGGGSTVNNSYIATNIPVAGYTPGQTYTVTLTIASSSGQKGFTIICENSSNASTGTYIITDATKTQLFNNHVTHKSAGTYQASWAFDWTAPASGTGTVTFYASFLKNGHNGGVANASAAFSEDLTSVSQAIESKEDFRIFPNPVSDLLNVEMAVLEGETVSLSIFSMTGQIVLADKAESTGNLFTGKYDLSAFKTGVYFIKVNSGSNIYTKKLFVR